MDNAQSQKPADTTAAPAPVADEAPKSKTKQAVAGAEGFDAQEAKLKPPDDPKAAPKGEKPAPAAPTDTPAEGAPKEEKSEADRMRAAVAGTAKKYDGKEFMSQAEIEKVRIEQKMPNYTTCIDFAGKAMRESAIEVFGKDWKKATETSAMLGQVKADWEKAVGAKNMAASYQKSVDRMNTSITDLQAKKALAAADIEKLRVAQEEGESELKYKQRVARAGQLEKAQLPAFDFQIKKLENVRDGIQKKIDKATEESKNIDAKNTAMIKAEDGMTNGRPKEGEYIILSQAPAGGEYGVTKVHLAGGSFKHIAIFMGVDQQDDGSGHEVWKTIDGGGTHGKTSMLRIRLADRAVFPAAGKMPAIGSAAGSQVAGWIDMSELIKMRDAKKAGGGK